MSRIICNECSYKCEIVCPKCGANDWEGKAKYYPNNSNIRKYQLRYLYCKNKRCPSPLGDFDCPYGKDLFRADFIITGTGVTLERF